MSSWVRRNSRTGIEYGGAASTYYWDNINPYTNFYVWYPWQGAPGAVYCNTYNLALPNCTTYAYGRILEAGDPAPHAANACYNANSWHQHLANGWTCVPYNFDDLELGDIVEWSNGNQYNHVAVVEELDHTNRLVYISQSFYTSDNGSASGDRTDTLWGTTKQSVSNYGINNAPNRFFIFSGIAYPYQGTLPNYILKNPDPHTPDPTTFFRFLTKKEKRSKKIIYV